MAQKQFPGENDGSVGPDTLRGIPAPEARKYNALYGDGEPLLAEGTTRELLPDGVDAEYRSPAELKMYGAREHETHTLLRDPARWEGLEMTNRAHEWMRRTPGGRIPLDENGQPFHDGDRIVALYPKALDEEREARQLRETDEYNGRVQRDKTGEFPDMPMGQWRADTDKAEMAEVQHQRNIESGMIGAHSGIRWEVARKELGEKWWKEQEDKYRSGNRHRRADVVNETQAQMIDAARNAAGGTATAMRGGGSKFTVGSIPANVRPQNTREAAARRRGQ